jgi:ketosteroid isomerase-like protein
MTEIESIVRDAYSRFGKGDIDGLMAMCRDDMTFYVPGDTRISGDHTKEAFVRDVIANVMALSGGTFREEILDVFTGANGAAVVLHHWLDRDGESYSYHATHNWYIEDGLFTQWWEYPHEYDQFAKAWA